MGDVENEIFLRIKLETLEDLREKLVRDLQPEKLFAFLRTKRVLDEDDCEEINAERTRRKKAEALLDMISKKGQQGFDFFCESFVIVGKTQLHLLNEILDMLESKLYDNEVKPLPLSQHEIVDVELLNQNLPRPGEPGAPCLPCYPIIPGIFADQPPLNDYFAANMNSPPPAYSAY